MYSYFIFVLYMLFILVLNLYVDENKTFRFILRLKCIEQFFFYFEPRNPFYLKLAQQTKYNLMSLSHLPKNLKSMTFNFNKHTRLHSYWKY